MSAPLPTLAANPARVRVFWSPSRLLASTVAEQSWKAELPCVTPTAPPAAAALLSRPTADVQARKTVFEVLAERPP